MKSLPEGRGLGTFIWEPTANNANQGLFEQSMGRGGRGGVAGTAPGTAPRAGGGAVVGVLPAKMAVYDQVVEKYGLKKLP